MGQFCNTANGELRRTVLSARYEVRYSSTSHGVHLALDVCSTPTHPLTAMQALGDERPTGPTARSFSHALPVRTEVQDNGPFFLIDIIPKMSYEIKGHVDNTKTASIYQRSCLHTDNANSVSEH